MEQNENAELAKIKVAFFENFFRRDALVKNERHRLVRFV